MSQSVKQRLQAMSTKVDIKELRPLVESILTDLGVLRTPVVAGVTDYTAGRAEIVKLVTDLTAARTALVNARVALTNIGLSDGAITIGTTPAKVKSTATINHLVDGVFYTKGATDDFWVLTGFDCTNAQFNKCLLCIDSSAAMQIVAGTEGASAGAVVLGAIPASYSVVGMVLVNPTGTGDFTGGTTDLNDGTVVPNAVYTDLAFHPDTFAAPAAITAINPAAVTAVAPAALTLTS
jgi:hypothetical protein